MSGTGMTIYDPRDEKIAALEQRVRELERACDAADDRADLAIRGTVRTMGNLRKQLSPLYRALQDVFGELDSVDTGVEESHGVVPVTAHTRAVWDSWKAKLGKTCATLIDALLEYGPLDSKALVVATKLHRTTLPRPIARLKQAGLLTTRGDGKYELRQL